MKKYLLLSIASFFAAITFAQSSDSQNVYCGDKVTVKADPIPGWHFVRWSDNGAQYHEVTADAAKSLIAYFEQDLGINIIVKVVESDGVTPVTGHDPSIGTGADIEIKLLDENLSPKTTFAPNETVNIVITYNDGCYAFVKWGDDSTLSSTRTYTMPAGNDVPTLELYVSIPQYNISVSVNGGTGGTVAIQ